MVIKLLQRPIESFARLACRHPTIYCHGPYIAYGLTTLVVPCLLLLHGLRSDQTFRTPSYQDLLLGAVYIPTSILYTFLLFTVPVATPLLFGILKLQSIISRIGLVSAVKIKDTETLNSIIQNNRLFFDYESYACIDKTFGIEQGRIAQFMNAISNGNIERLQKYLAENPEIIFNLLDNNLPELLVGIKKNQKKIIKLIFDLLPALALYTDTGKNTLLHQAVWHACSLKKISLLVTVCPEMLTQKDRSGNTPVELAKSLTSDPNFTLKTRNKLKKIHNLLSDIGIALQVFGYGQFDNNENPVARSFLNNKLYDRNLKKLILEILCGIKFQADSCQHTKK